MMRLRGRLVLLFFVILCIASPAQGVTPHEYFDKTDEDLYAIISFLTDIKVLCEESLDYSFSGNCTIDFSDTLDIVYSQENLDLSVIRLQILEDKIFYSSDILELLREKAGSYQYLKDFLNPIKDLGSNVSSFVTNHSNVVVSFRNIVDFLDDGSNETNAVYVYNNASLNVTKCRNILDNIGRNLDEINESFSLGFIRSKLSDLYGLMNKYDNYLRLLLNVMTINESKLFLYVDTDQVYYDEDLHAFGYMIADKAFAVNQTVEINWDDKFINTNFTDEFGRYDFVIPVGLYQNPGVHNLKTSTFYNNTLYYSANVLINLKKIPTKINISIPKDDYYLKETIIFSGLLVDFKDRGIKTNVSLSFSDYNVSLKSDENGDFIFVFKNNLSFGSYTAIVFFNPFSKYEKCYSKPIVFNVNTPTFLTVNISKKNGYHIGDRLNINGFLVNGINGSSLVNKTIEIFLNNKKIGVTETNHQGCYSYTYSTDDLCRGEYKIYAGFVSDDYVFRSCKSNVIELHLQEDFTQQLLKDILIIAFIMFLTIILFIFRVKIINFIKKQTPSVMYTSSKTPVVTPYKLDKTRVDLNEYTIDTSLKKYEKDAFKKAIISKYESLINFLSKHGMIINSGVTHLDMQEKMLKEGFSKKATNIVTEAFEYAMYSQYDMDKKEVTLFNEHIVIILKNAGGFWDGN